MVVPIIAVRNVRYLSAPTVSVRSLSPGEDGPVDGACVPWYRDNSTNTIYPTNSTDCPAGERTFVAQ